MRNPIGWFEIHVQDMARARAFYEAVFGQTLQPLPSPGGEGMEMLAFPMQQGSHGASGALVKMAGMPSGGNSTLVVLATAATPRERQNDAASLGPSVSGRRSHAWKQSGWLHTSQSARCLSSRAWRALVSLRMA